MDSPFLFYSQGIDFSHPRPSEVAQWLQEIIHQHGQQVEEITFIFCDDAFLLQLNRQHLQHDYYTDILTFPLTESGSGVPLSADIYISIDRVKENAKDFDTPFFDELHRVMVHGVLHLLGYNDHEEEEKEKMRKKENEALKLLNGVD